MVALLKFLRTYWPLAIIFAVCILAFLVDLVAFAQDIWISQNLLMVPHKISGAWENLLAGNLGWGSLSPLSTLVSYAFFHADFGHIFWNLLFIWIFGSLVLRELGAVWFFICYFLAAIAGGLAQTLLDPQSTIPTLGASGALMGLEGIYFGMAMRWRLPNPDVWPIAEPIPQERLMILAGFGILMDISGVIGQSGNIAYGAHIGGFICGMFLATVVIPRPRNAQ
ncbi:MAG: rhomboid family intramembrane serine protease [Opitutales bacterium]